MLPSRNAKSEIKTPNKIKFTIANSVILSLELIKGTIQVLIGDELCSKCKK